MLLKAIIIDDNVLARTLLARRIRQDYADVMEVVGQTSTAADACLLIRKHQPDVMFLDVELPDRSGIDLLNSLRRGVSLVCRTVIYTAHPQYLIDALRASAFDFLHKPIDDGELEQVVRRLVSETADPSRPARDGHDIQDLLAPGANILRLNDVCLFRVLPEGRCWEAVTGLPTAVRIKQGFNADDILRLGPQFVRISRDRIVNISYVQEIRDGRCFFFPPFRHVTDATVSRRFLKGFTEALLRR